MTKQLLGEIEQNIVICQWRGDRLLAEAPAFPLACSRCSENETLPQLAALKSKKPQTKLTSNVNLH